MLWNITKSDAIIRLSNSKLDDKGTFLNVDFGANKTPVELIKEGAFGAKEGTHFRDIYFGVTGTWCKNSWKEFDELKNIDKNYYCLNYYAVSVNKYGVNIIKYGVEHH